MSVNVSNTTQDVVTEPEIVSEAMAQAAAAAAKAAQDGEKAEAAALAEHGSHTVDPGDLIPRDESGNPAGLEGGLDAGLAAHGD